MPDIRQVHISQMPEGAERYGVHPTAEQAALVPSFATTQGTQLAPPSGIPYGRQDVCTAITANGSACTAPKAHGTQFCLGHLRKIEKMQREGNEGGIPVDLEHSKE